MLIAAILAAIVGIAQQGDTSAPQPSEQLQALVRSPGYQGNVARLFAALPSDVFQRCATLVSDGSQVTVLTPVSFAADGYPVSGMWKQSFPVRGCGNDTTINLFFKGQPDEKITSIVAVPGDTHADPTLQRDAVRYAWLGAKAIAPTCTTPHARHTRYDGVVDAKHKAWRETWIVAACGQNVEIPITFTPDATGTTITAKMPKPLG